MAATTPKFSIKLKSSPSFEKLIYLIVSFGFRTKKPLEESIPEEINEQFKKEVFEQKLNSKNPVAMRVQIKRKQEEYLNSLPESQQYTYSQVKVSTRLKCPEKFFDKGSRTFIKEYSNYNQKIEALKHSIQLVYESLAELNRDVTPESFKEQIDKIIFKKESGQTQPKEIKQEEVYKSVTKIVKQNKVHIKAPTLFTDYITWKVNELERTNDTERGEATRESYIKFKGWLLKFEEKKLGKEKIDLLNLNDDMIKDYFEFATNEKKDDGSYYALNYISWMKKTWKLLIREARNEDNIPIENVNLEKKILKRKNEEPDDVYLNMQQLEKLRNSYEDLNKFEQIILDIFLVGCNCGYRVSDLATVDLFTSDGVEYYFTTTSHKTRTKVKIPVFESYIIDIYRKYNDSFPSRSEQYINRTINEICRKAGFTYKVEIAHFDFGTNKLVKKKVEFCELVTTKTCRKTFCSNMIRHYKLPLPVAMSYSGHGSEKQYKRYIALSAAEYLELGREALALMRRTG